MAAYVNFMKKWVGDNKRNIACGDDVIVFVEDIENQDVENLDPNVDPEYAALAHITDVVIRASYKDCKPVNNWIRGADRKLLAISSWRETATAKDC